MNGRDIVGIFIEREIFIRRRYQSFEGSGIRGSGTYWRGFIGGVQESQVRICRDVVSNKTQLCICERQTLRDYQNRSAVSIEHAV